MSQYFRISPWLTLVLCLFALFDQGFPGRQAFVAAVSKDAAVTLGMEELGAASNFFSPRDKPYAWNRGERAQNGCDPVYPLELKHMRPESRCEASCRIQARSRDWSFEESQQHRQRAGKIGSPGGDF